ncbi:MAG: peptidoglycan editing factor PgeF [Gammaproteobacteria bacterium]
MKTNAEFRYLVPDWPAPGNVFAATTLRLGGVSRAPYASLNPALHVGDDAACVMENRRLLREGLKLPAEPVWLEQVHGACAVDAALLDEPVAADAGFSREPGIVCAVMTADCLPLLLCTADGRAVAAVHAGWRGLLAGVIGNAVAALGDANPLVWLGPAIGPDAFEVGPEVRQAFIDRNPAYDRAFLRHQGNKWLADIYRLARIYLAGIGVEKVYGGDRCTVTESDHFFSYRRDKITGRMASLIWRS